ncbi:MAG: hypothetical protein QME68_07960 [Elusimicrobiota bacterium]|nr:hypothetical protein [Elusimicrobiota bacterium]
MRLYEYEAKQIFKTESISVPESVLIEKDSIIIGLEFFNKHAEGVLKSQVLTGARGKSGGIKTASSKQEFLEKAVELFTLTVRGFKVKKNLS